MQRSICRAAVTTSCTVEVTTAADKASWAGVKPAAWHGTTRRDDAGYTKSVTTALAGGKVNRSTCASKLKIVPATRGHDADTLNLIHAQGRSGQRFTTAGRSVQRRLIPGNLREYASTRTGPRDGQAYNKGLREFQNTIRRQLPAFTQPAPCSDAEFSTSCSGKGGGRKQRFLASSTARVRQHCRSCTATAKRSTTTAVLEALFSRR